MKFTEAQEIVRKFDDARNWNTGAKHLKDFLLNIHEEVGEVWNIIKWVDEKTQQELVIKHKDEFVDFVGDELFLILKIAYLLDIDAEEAFKRTMEDYEKRFPADRMKQVKHGNPLAGGIDNKGD